MRVKTGWRVRTLGILIGLLLLLGVPMAAQADSVSLTWNPNTEPDLAGYKLYTGTSPGSYSQIFDVGHGTSYTVSSLVPGNTYYFALTAYDIYANESGFSTEMSTTISGAPGSTPADTTTSSSEDQRIPQDDDPDFQRFSWYSWLLNLLFGS